VRGFSQAFHGIERVHEHGLGLSFAFPLFPTVVLPFLCLNEPVLHCLAPENVGIGLGSKEGEPPKGEKMHFPPKKLFHPTIVGKAAIALLLTSAAMAQFPLFQSRRVVGWSDLPAPNMASYLDIQDVDNNCQKAQTFCKYPANLPLKPQAYNSYSGGTAYDARYRTVWVSDGKILAEYAVRGCKPRCKPMKAVLLDPSAYVSGLAISQKKPRLFQLATKHYYFEVVTYDLRKCPKAVARCAFKFPTNGGLVRPLAGGIAYDEVNDRLYISISYRNPQGGYDHLVYVTNASSPCKPICKARIMNCSKNLVTGLAYDNCKRELYATDGQATQVHFVSANNPCLLKIGFCCKKQIPSKYRGLSLIPGFKPGSKGKSCSQKPCPTCNTMLASWGGGDPVMGNQNFKLTLNNGPSGGIGIVVLRGAACSNLGIPFLCGKFYAINGPIILVAATFLGGSGGCTGNGSVPVPLPASPAIAQALCGKSLCAQWLVYCKNPIGSGFGGISNAVEFKITN
jgi:hypothetical protein